MYTNILTRSLFRQAEGTINKKKIQSVNKSYLDGIITTSTAKKKEKSSV